MSVATRPSVRLPLLLSLAAIGTAVVMAQDATPPAPPATTAAAPAPVAAPAAAPKPSRAELRERQLDVLLETRDIERVLTKLKRASELSKTRIGEVAKVAESASESLDRGESKQAQGSATQAVEMYREIVKLLAALLAEETPQKLAAARNLANQLSKNERQFAQQFKGALNPTANGGKAKLDPNSKSNPNDPPRPPMPNGEGKNGDNPMPKPAAKDGAGGAAKPDAKPGDDMPPANGKGRPKDKPGDDMPPADGSGRPMEKPGDDMPPPNGAGPTKGKPADENDKDPMPGAGDKPDKTPKAKPDEQGGGDEKGDDEQRRDALANRAAQLAKSGETLKDILDAIAQSTEPGDKEAVEKIQAALKEIDLMKAIEAMQDAADMIRSGQLDEARLASLDIADRMEILAQRLDTAFRGIVAPQAEELRKLEQALADLREKLDQLETQGQIAAWHREARDLLDRAEKLGISERAREDLLEQMKKAGLSLESGKNTFNWGFLNDRYVSPDGYAVPIVRLQEEIQTRIQTLLLGEVASAADENTPPKYQELVDRYYEILSRDRKK